MTTYTIKDVALWTVHRKHGKQPTHERIVLTLETFMMLNRSQLKSITEQLGTETDDWLGEEIDIEQLN